MLMRSISDGSADATAHAIAFTVILANNCSRSSAGTAFESLTFGM